MLTISILIFCSFLAVFSCGLESPPYLEPPDRMDLSEIYKVFFSNGDSRQNDIDFFDGFEIIYRFYDPIDEETYVEDEDILIDRADYLTSINLTHLFNREYNRLSYSSDLRAVLYRRLDSIDEIEDEIFSRPLINLNETGKTGFKSSPCVFVIDFSSVFYPIDDHCSIMYPDPSNLFSETFARYVENADGEVEMKSFLPEDLEEGDDDLPESLFASDREYPAEEVTIVLYAASFGRDEDFNGLYSDAVYLGKLTLPLNPLY